MVISSISNHLMNTKNPGYKNGRLVISSKQLAHGMSMWMGALAFFFKEESSKDK